MWIVLLFDDGEYMCGVMVVLFGVLYDVVVVIVF